LQQQLANKASSTLNKLEKKELGILVAYRRFIAKKISILHLFFWDKILLNFYI
jgi:hypothetical protein